MDAQVDRVTSSLYARLEERVMARDQIGASQVYYDLVRAGRPLKEIVAEGVRIHAPYTHVPYHERIDDGYPNFVNNDHCLLSARATINLAKMVPERLAMLPMAQTIWYIPSGLDIWNHLRQIDRRPRAQQAVVVADEVGIAVVDTLMIRHVRVGRVGTHALGHDLLQRTPGET